MDRGAAPIPEEYQNGPPAPRSAPKPPPLPPSAPPPAEDTAAHEAFEKARIEAAKKREAARPLSFRRFLPKLPSSPRNNEGSARSLDEDPLEHAVRGGEKPQGRRSFTRFMPKLPSHPPPEVDDAAHTESDRLQQQAHANRKKSFTKFLPRLPSAPHTEVDDEAHAEFDRLRYAAMAKRKHGDRSSTPLARVLVGANSMFSFNPPPLVAQPGEDDGEKVTDIPKPEPKLVFKNGRERCIYEIKHRHALERALMACLAVCLLWLTSLAVARSIVISVIKGPPLNLVVSEARKAQNQTVSQQSLYATCATRRVGDCNRSFVGSLNNEVNRLNGILLQNRILLDNITDMRGTCSDRFGDVVMSLDYLVNVKARAIAPEFGLRNFTSDPTCSQVEKILKDQIAAIKAQEKAAVFKAVADEKVLSIQEQFRARAKYDRDYLLNSTVGLALGGDALNQLVSDPQTFFSNITVYRNQFLACGTSSNTYNGQTCQGTNLRAQVANARNQFIQNYETLRGAAVGYANSLQAQFTPLQTFYNAFKSAMTTVSGLKSALDGAANNNGGGGGGLSAFGFTDIDVNLPPLGVGSLSSFTGSIGSTAASDQIQDQQTGGLVAGNANTQDKMNADADAAKAGQTGWIPGFMSDYNPPPYDIDLASGNWAQKSSEFLPDIQSDLALVARRVEGANVEEFKPTINVTDSGRKAQELLQDHAYSPLDVFFYDNIDPMVMLAQWNQITNLALIMDYTYRVLRSISIIRTYWRVSAVMAPPADVRAGKGHKKGAVTTVRRNPDQALAYIITHPAVNLFLALLFLGLITAAFLKLYLPFYNDYARGCVLAEKPGSTLEKKTTITSNANTIAFNIAASDGDQITATDIDRVNVEREVQCSTNEDLVFKQQRLYLQEYDFNEQKMKEVKTQVDAFRSCINATKLDSVMGSGSKGLAFNATNGTSSSVFASLNHSSCDTPFRTLDYQQFDCRNIAICRPECTGPNSETIQFSTFTAGCKGENYMHASILGTALSALAFILMNLSRYTFLRGMRRAMLSHFAIGEYSYIASTDEHGNQEFPEEVTQDGISMKSHIRDELHRTIRAYERSGIYICIIGLIINVPWVVALIYFGDTIEFKG